MSADVERAIERIRALPWRGIEFVGQPRLAEAPPAGRGPTAAPRALSDTCQLLLEILRKRPGWHRTRELADRTSEPSRRICSAMDTLVRRGLAERRPVGLNGGRGRPGMMYRGLGLALALAVTSGPAEAHGVYTGLRSPSGVPCCDDRDCRPVDACTLPDGKQGIPGNGGCWPIEYDKVLPGVSSPDGSLSACWGNQIGKPGFLCIILPGMAQAEPDPGPALAWLENAAAGICRAGSR